jgi:Putative Ig domain
MTKHLLPATGDFKQRVFGLHKRFEPLPLIPVVMLCLLWVTGCGGGGGTTIMVGIIPNSAQMVDQGSSLTFQATTANDTANMGAGKGVTWMLTGTGCAGTGCGKLTNVMPNSVTYTAPMGDTTTLTVTLTATSVANTHATATVSIAVELPPTFTTLTLPGGTNGTPYSQQIQVTNGVAPLTFALAPGSTLPGGLVLSSTGLISGRPTGPAPPPAANPTLFDVVVTDNANPKAMVTSPQYSIAINPAPPLVVTQTSPMPPGTLHIAYDNIVATSGGVKPFTWSKLSGCLPPGLQLISETGHVTGTPTSATSCAFTPQVTDSSIPPQVQSSAGPLTISVNAPPALSVVGGALPGGFVASPYSASIGITGGVPPYQNIVVTNGQLPSGLSLNPTTGVITGVPVIGGSVTSTFSVQVQDSATPPNVAFSPPGDPLTIEIANGNTDPNSLLSGTYVLLFNGFSNSGAVAIAGFITANGAGQITGGMEDINSVGAVTVASTVSGTYSLTADGRGTMEINTLDNVGRPFNSAYRIALDSSGNARLFEDNSVLTVQPPVAIHGAGRMKLQQGSSFGASNFGGNYSFAFSGPDVNAKPAALVGTVHADQNVNLGPGLADFNDAGTYNSALALSGNFSVTSTTGRGTASLVFQPGNQAQTTLQFSFYFVSPGDLFFVETDTPDATHPRLSGEMIQQQPAVKFDSTALASPAVVTGSGVSTNASVFVGLLTQCNPGPLCLTYSENNGGSIANPVAPFASGVFTISNNGRVGFTNPAGLPTLGNRVVAAYLTGVSQGFLIGSDPAVTVGLLEQQTGGNPNFSAASVFDGYTLSAPVTAENMVKDLNGQIIADGAVTMSGLIDEIDPTGKTNIGSPFSAGFLITDPVAGQGTLTTNAPAGLDTNFVFYIVSPSSIRAISVDPTDKHPEVVFIDH